MARAGPYHPDVLLIALFRYLLNLAVIFLLFNLIEYSKLWYLFIIYAFYDICNFSYCYYVLLDFDLKM